MLETLAYWLIGIGLAFDLLGCIGLVRLPDVYNRAQAATKCVTLGTCTILVGVGLWGAAGGNTAMAIKAILCAGFILLTSPVAAHAVCRGAYLSGVRLWDQSVQDAFESRAKDIQDEQAAEGSVHREETEAS